MTHMPVPKEIEHVSVGSLTPYARNSRTHSEEQVLQIAASIREFGFTNPVLIDADGGIIAGHGRVLAATRLGLNSVPCIRLPHLSEAQRRAYVIADNKLALNAGWDEELLAMELRDLGDLGVDLDLTGFGRDEIAELLAANVEDDGRQDADELPPPQERVVTQLGDVWCLGAHRLMCGDCTDASVRAVLLKGESVDVCWTDPPYNVAYETAAGSIANDDLPDEEFSDLMHAALRGIFHAVKPGAAVYVSHADNIGLVIRQAFSAAGFKLSQCLIWRKDALVLGRADYQWIHEPILYGWRPGASHKFFGGRAQTTVSDIGRSGSPFVRLDDGRWQVTIGEEVMVVDGTATVEFVEHSVLRELRPRRSVEHPTMKPVALIERMLRNSARQGSLVFDPFGGSGSTMIAADRLGMRGRLIELSPAYCDVIVRRWQEFTGAEARLDGASTSFAELARVRD